MNQAATIALLFLALSIAAEPGSAADRLGAAVDSLQSAGMAAYAAGDFETARDLLARARSLLADAAPGDQARMAWLNSDLAEMHRLLGDYAGADSLLSSAVANSRSVEQTDPLLPAYLINLAAMRWELGDLDHAEDLLRDAQRELATRPDADPLMHATLALNLGVLLRDQNRIDEAESYLLDARRQAATAVTDSTHLAFFISEPAKLRAAQGRWREAIALWNEVLPLVAADSRPLVIYRAQILLDMAAAHAARGEWTTALASVDSAIDLRRKALGPEHSLVGAALAMKAQMLHQGGSASPRLVRDTAAAALAILAASPAAVVEHAAALAARANGDYALDARAAARRDMTAMVALVESLRPQRGGLDIARIHLLQRFQQDYETLVAWLVEAGEYADALSVSEKLKARVLAERLALDFEDLRRHDSDDRLATLLAAETAARTRLNRHERDLAFVRTGGGVQAPGTIAVQDSLWLLVNNAYREHEAAAAALRRYRETSARSAEADPGQRYVDMARGAMAAGRLILAYHIADAGSYVFVLSQEMPTLRCYPLVYDEKRAAADAVATALTPGILNQLLSRTSLRSAPESGRGVTGISPVTQPPAPADHSNDDGLARLWRYLMPPDIRDEVLSAQEVVVISSGELAMLPFDALIVGPGPRYWLDCGPPLRTVPSLAFLTAMSARAAGSRRPAWQGAVVSVAAPDFAHHVDPTGQTWPALPGTRREAEAVLSAFGADRVRLLLNGDATERRVRAELHGASIIHIATHGFAEERAPWRAGLVLAAAGHADDDGVLRRHEIETMELACDLAVLSACQTAAGQIVPAEGVRALAHAFALAGCHRTVATLWAVDDQAAATLMDAFFHHLARGIETPDAISVSAALQHAKRELRERTPWSSPYHWGAFVCSGIE